MLAPIFATTIDLRDGAGFGRVGPHGEPNKDGRRSGYERRWRLGGGARAAPVPSRTAPKATAGRVATKGVDESCVGLL